MWDSTNLLRIIEETADLLKLGQRPYLLYFLGLFLIAASMWAVATQVLLATEYNERALGVIIFIAGFGGFVLLSASATTVIFDKPAGTVTVRRQSLVHRREKTYKLSAVAQVTVYSGREHDPSAYFVSRTYHLLLMMKKGKHVQLAGGGKLQLARLNDTAVYIQKFLKA